MRFKSIDSNRIKMACVPATAPVQRLFFILLLIKGLNCMYDEEGPTFTDEPPSKVEFINELGARLNCSARGRPDPTIQWTLGDGSQLSEVPRLRYSSASDGSLVFAPFPAESFRPDVHSATYRCIAANSVGTIVSRDVQLRAVVKQSYETRVQAPRIVNGFPAILECVVNPGYMRDYILITSWVRDKSYNILPSTSSSIIDSTSDSKYQMLPDGKLIIWQVGPQDARYSYQCRTLHRLTGQTAVSPPGKLVTFDLDRPSRPMIQYRLSSIIAKESELVVLPCFAHGLPKPSYRWYKKEGARLTSVIDDSPDETGRHNSMYHSPSDSRNIQQSQHHQHQSSVSSSYRHDSSSSSSSNVGAGSSSNSHSSAILASSSGMKLLHGALIINSVKVANKGLYLCNVSNSEGSELLEVELIVRSPLTVNLHPKKLSVDLGKSAEFTCSIVSGGVGAGGEPQQSSSSSSSSGSTPSSTIHWLKDGVPLLSAAGTSGGSRVRFLGHNRISIQSVTREDQGMYQCMAKNDYGSVQQSAQLWLGDAYPQFIYRFIEQTLQPGPAVSLKCSARGNPTPQVSWFLDGFPLPQSDRFLIGQYANVYGDVVSHVNITSSRAEDSGEYQCFFENRAGKARHAARLNIYGQPFVRAMPDILATAGQRMTIKCPVGGYPVEIIIWERDGMKLPMTDRQSVSNNGTFIVEPVDRADAGQYTCIAGNNKGAMSQRTVNVRVMVPPKITPFSFAADPHVGERASIQCVVVKGDLPLTITWLKDNYPIITNINSGTVVLSSPTQSSSNSSPPSSSGFLKLHHHHEQQQQQPHDVNTHHHHMYLMSTSLVGHNNNNHLSSSNNGHGQHGEQANSPHFPSHNHNLRLSIRQLDHFSSVLSIPSLEPEHSGNFTCRASNKVATSTYTATLLVNVPPRISSFSFGDGLMEGMRTQVICTTTAGDEPLKLTWAKGNQLLEGASSSEGDVGGGVHVSYFPPFSTILTIPNITASNSGNFSCRVSNLAGYAVHTAELIVTVPAKWVVEPTDQSVYVGTHVAIHCKAEGFPKPTIRWKQAVGNLEKKEFREVGYRTPGVLSAENGTLIISRVTEDHEGHYLCQASGGVGPGISKLIRLTVNAAPRIRARPPKEMVRRGEIARLRCEAEGDEPIKITWNVKGTIWNETNDNRYSVDDIPGSGPGSPAVSELIIQQVSLSDRGEFECIAVNSFGHDSLRISLLVQERPQPPKEFRAIEHSSRSVVLSWALPTSENDAHVLDYVISFKEESEKWSETTTRRKSTSGDQNSLVVSGLLPAVTYHFRLQARNQLGTSEPTQVFEVTTDGEPPSGPPQYVTVEPVSSTELRISWQPPAKERRHGIMLGYNIGIKRTSEEIGLYNWTRIENTQGDISSGTVTSSSSSSLSSSSSSSSNLASGKGNGSSGSIAGTGGSSETGSGGGTTVPVLSTILSGLDKFTEYEVVVQAYNQLGEGPTSSPSVAATLEDVPGAAPTDVTCSSSTAHSVTVSWEPPSRKHAHGTIVSFRVVLEAIPDDDEFLISNYFSGGVTTTGSSGSGNSGGGILGKGGNEVETGISSGVPLSISGGLELDSRVTSTNTVVHGLTPYTNYSVSVTAATAVGDGVYSLPIFCRTLESVPDAPAGIKGMAATLESVIVTWQRPRNENGRIVKFHVYIRILDHGSGRELRTVKKTVPPSTWNYEVTDLKRREAYEAWVTAETRIGEGARSSSVSFTASSLVPAGIISFGKVIATPWKADVLMPCLTVGVPAPIVTWRRRGGRIIDPASNARYVINKDNTLLIKTVQRSDNGNYSCMVKNPEGSDHIVYVLHVQVPPAPPLLHPTTVTANSVRLQWKQGDNGGAPIQGFVLNFRPMGGEWEEITLNRKLSTYVVERLNCGRPYEFFLIGYNKIGGGPPSDTISVTTKGSRPVKPTAAHFLVSNSSSITLNLVAWNSSDCPVTSFVIEYRPKTASSWSLVRQQSDGTITVVTSVSGSPSPSSSLLSSQIGAHNKRVQINDLTPETDYIIRVTGNNGAGSTTAEYEISTSLFKGGLTSNSFNFNSRSRGSSNSGTSSASSSSSSSGNRDGSSASGNAGDNLPFYQDMHIILPLVISLLAIISMSVSAFYCWRKHGNSTTSSPQESTKPTKAFTFRRADGNGLLFGGGGNDVGANTLGIDRDYTIIREKFISDCDRIPETAEDIYPYATFHLPMKESLGENIGEGFFAATAAAGQSSSSSPRLSNAEAIQIRQMARGNTAMIGGGGRNKSSRRKSQGGGSSGGSGNTRSTPVAVNGPVIAQSTGSGSPGESEEYDDSCGSESDDCTHPHHHHHQHHQHSNHQLQQQQHFLMGTARYAAVPGGQAGGIYGGQGGGRPLFLNDETLLVSDKDRKSLPRGLRPKFSYESSSGIGSMLSPGPVSSSSTAGYQIAPGGLGRSSGSSGGSSTVSRGGGNYTTSTTDETSFILMSAGLGNGNATASAAIHPQAYDYDYDLVAAAAAVANVSSSAHGNKYLGGNTTSRQSGSSNLAPAPVSAMNMNTLKLQNASGGVGLSNAGRMGGGGGGGGGLLGGDSGSKGIKTDLISHHHHHHHHHPQQQSSDYTIAV